MLSRVGGAASDNSSASPLGSPGILVTRRHVYAEAATGSRTNISLRIALEAIGRAGCGRGWRGSELRRATMLCWAEFDLTSSPAAYAAKAAAIQSRGHDEYVYQSIKSWWRKS